jgi:hypothetical protein
VGDTAAAATSGADVVVAMAPAAASIESISSAVLDRAPVRCRIEHGGLRTSKLGPNAIETGRGMHRRLGGMRAFPCLLTPPAGSGSVAPGVHVP